ncbi:uncharacterized protein [Vulpes vulpes]|uniref:Uncharacterized protein isoform X2 n=1 Tax=Vulpes vulpes TaxID=9627 RepID=A0ABM5A264_VULVU
MAPQSWHPRNCRHTFTWAQGLQPTAREAPSSLASAKRKRAAGSAAAEGGGRGAGAEGARGRAQEAGGAARVPAAPAPVGGAPRPAPELPAAAWRPRAKSREVRSPSRRSGGAGAPRNLRLPGTTGARPGELLGPGDPPSGGLRAPPPVTPRSPGPADPPPPPPAGGGQERAPRRASGRAGAGGGGNPASRPPIAMTPAPRDLDAALLPHLAAVRLPCSPSFPLPAPSLSPRGPGRPSRTSAALPRPAPPQERARCLGAPAPGLLPAPIVHSSLPLLCPVADRMHVATEAGVVKQKKKIHTPRVPSFLSPLGGRKTAHQLRCLRFSESKNKIEQWARAVP